MRGALAAFVLSCLFSVSAYADDDPVSAYARGDFLEAAAAGEARGDEAGLSVAAKSLLALTLGDARSAEAGQWLDRAERASEAALNLAPEALEPRLHLAAALGMKSRRAGIAEALKRNYARRGRALINEALAIAPVDARAHALLGGWNLEVVRRGGGLGARLFGASARAGVAAFDRARELAPDDPAIALHYAMALLSLDPKKNEEKIGSLLHAAGAMATDDAFEAASREEARRLAAVMASGGAEAAARQVAAAFL